MYREAMGIGVLAVSTALSELGESNVYVGIMMLVAFTIFAYYAVALWQMLRPTPPHAERFQEKTECEKHRLNAASNLKDLDAEFNERMAKMSEYSARSRKGIYESIETMKSDVAVLKSTDEAQTQRLVSMELKLDKILFNLKK